MLTTGTFGFSVEIGQKAMKKNFSFKASPVSLKLFYIWPDVNGVKKKALSAKRGQLFEHSELLPGAVDKAFFSQFTASLEFLLLLLQGKSKESLFNAFRVK